MAVRFADRVGKGIRNPPCDALVAASAGEHQRGLVFGLHRDGDTAGAVVGIAIAAAIIWWSQSAATGLMRHTFQLAVLFSTVPAAVAVIVLAVGAREIRPAAVDSDHPENIGHADRRFKLYFLVVAAFTLGHSSGSFMVLRAQERDLTVLQIMGMLMSFTLVHALCSGRLGICRTASDAAD